jgi:hypothetical protein
MIINSNTVGERDDVTQSVYATVTCGYNIISCLNNKGENMKTSPSPVVSSELYTQMGHISDNHNISGHTQGNYVNDRGSHYAKSYNHNMDTHLVLDLRTCGTNESDIHNETYIKVDHIRNSCSHNTNSRHSQDKVNKTTNATSSGCTV